MAGEDIKVCKWCGASSTPSSRGYCGDCEVASNEAARAKMSPHLTAKYDAKGWPPPRPMTPKERMLAAEARAELEAANVPADVEPSIPIEPAVEVPLELVLDPPTPSAESP